MSRVFYIINIAYERLLIRKRKQLSKKILSLCYSLYKSCFRKYITYERMLLLCFSADVLQSRSLSRSILTEVFMSGQVLCWQRLLNTSRWEPVVWIACTRNECSS